MLSSVFVVVVDALALVAVCIVITLFGAFDAFALLILLIAHHALTLLGCRVIGLVGGG